MRFWSQDLAGISTLALNNGQSADGEERVEDALRALVRLLARSAAREVLNSPAMKRHTDPTSSPTPQMPETDHDR